MKSATRSIRLDRDTEKILQVKTKAAGMKTESDFIRSCIRHSDATKIQNAVEIAEALAQAVHQINLNCTALRIRIHAIEKTCGSSELGQKILQELSQIESNALKEVAEIGNRTSTKRKLLHRR